MSIWLTTKCSLILTLRLPFLECEGGWETADFNYCVVYLTFWATDRSLEETPESLLKWKAFEERIVPPLGSIHSDGPALTLLGLHRE